MMVSWKNWLPNTRPVFSLHQLQCVACIIFHSWTHMTTWHEPCRPRTGSTVFWQSAENKKCSLDIADKDRCGPPRSFRVCRHFGGRSFDVVQSFWFQTQKWKTHISTMITSKFVWLLCHEIGVISFFRARLNIFKAREFLAILGLKIGSATWIPVAPAARFEV